MLILWLPHFLKWFGTLWGKLVKIQRHYGDFLIVKKTTETGRVCKLINLKIFLRQFKSIENIILICTTTNRKTSNQSNIWLLTYRILSRLILKNLCLFLDELKNFQSWFLLVARCSLLSARFFLLVTFWSLFSACF